MAEELFGTKPDRLATEVIAAFRGRDIPLFEELPRHIPATAIVSLVRRGALRVVAVGPDDKRKLAWRIVH
jgi:hypothetical protein